MDLKTIKQITEKEIGEKVIKIVRDDKGLHNYNYIITTESRIVVAKVSGSENAILTQVLKKQFNFLKKYSKQLNLPLAIKYSERNQIERPILFLGFLNGKHIDFNDLTNSQIKNLAREVTKIHSISSDKYSGAYAAPPRRKGTHFDYATTFTETKVFKEYEKYSCYIKDKNHQKVIESSLAFLSSKLQNQNLFKGTKFSLLHTDIGKNNLIWQKDEPIFIDWDDKMYGDPASEVGYIFAINNSDTRFRKAFLAEYKKHLWDSSFPERVKFYELMNRLFDVMWSLSKFDKNSNTLKTKNFAEYEGYYIERYMNLKNYLSTNRII